MKDQEVHVDDRTEAGGNTKRVFGNTFFKDAHIDISLEVDVSKKPYQVKVKNGRIAIADHLCNSLNHAVKCLLNRAGIDYDSFEVEPVGFVVPDDEMLRQLQEKADEIKKERSK